MRVNEAFEKIKKEYPNLKVIECLEFSAFYAFALTEDEGEEFGGGYYTVNKESGEISTFNPTSDMESFMAAKTINI